MRTLKTYILRLLIDQGASGVNTEFHGSLQSIGELQIHPFQSGQALLSLLQEMTQEKPEDETQNKEEEFDT
jgi:hypothetical protein